MLKRSFGISVQSPASCSDRSLLADAAPCHVSDWLWSHREFRCEAGSIVYCAVENRDSDVTSSTDSGFLSGFFGRVRRKSSLYLERCFGCAAQWSRSDKRHRNHFRQAVAGGNLFLWRSSARFLVSAPDSQRFSDAQCLQRDFFT